MKMIAPGNIVVEVPESKAEKLSLILGYKYLVPDETPLEEISEPVTPKPRRGRPRST